MHIDFVIGANYGDEGKGLVTHTLAKKYIDEGHKVLNVLTNGGPQRGHTVEAPGFRHVFHHFGSGTYAGADNYISSQFLVDPIKFMVEYRELQKKIPDWKPSIYISPNARLITPFDVFESQVYLRANESHVGCGCGIYETIERSKNPKLNLEFFDIAYLLDDGLRHALNAIKEIFYWEKSKANSPYIEAYEHVIHGIDIDKLIECYCEECYEMIHIARKMMSKSVLDIYDNIILENGQGLLLSNAKMNKYTTSTDTDSYIDFYVTKKDLFIPAKDSSLCVNYVTRTYETRHGEDPAFENYQIDNEDETNTYNEFQGAFKVDDKFIDLKELRTRILLDRTQYPVSIGEYKSSDHAIWITHGQKTFESMTFSQYYHKYMYNLNRDEADSFKRAFRNMHLSKSKYGEFEDFC